MARTFHDDATKFMADLIKLLERESQSRKVGESLTSNETAASTLLRIIGILQDPKLDNSETTETTVQQALPNLVDDLFKIQNTRTDQQLQQINNLLNAFRKRLTRYSKARNQIKLKRTQKLIEIPENPINPADLVKNSPEETSEAVAKKQQQIREEGDLKGVIDQDISLQRALELSINQTVDLPAEAGAFSSQLRRFMTAMGKEAGDKIENLQLRKQEIQNEVNRLENSDNLLFQGAPVFGNTEKTLSLLKVIDVLIFLTDRKRVKFNCSECKNFRQGRTNACIFAGTGAISPAPLVTLTDEQGNPIIGRLTRPTNSCKQTWDLESNEYWQASEDLTNALNDLLED